jgi:hypothetical protein
MTTLRDAPYNLEYNSYVVATVKSYNAYGWSIVSQPSTGGAVI